VDGSNPRDVATQLHGGEPRPTGEQIAAVFRRSRVRHAGLMRESDAVRALACGRGLAVRRTTFFTAEGAEVRIRYGTEGGTVSVTLAEAG